MAEKIEEKVMSLDFNFTPRVINEIEVASGKAIQDVLASFSVRTVLLFVQKGLGLNEDEALNKIEKYLDSGGDTLVLYTEIMEALQTKGFLPRGMNLKKVKVDMQKEIQKI